MDRKVFYKNSKERQLLVIGNEKDGYRMLHDTFDADWKQGDEPHGTMIFTDEPTPIEPMNPAISAFSKATTIDQKLELIAKRVGLIK